MPSLLLVTFAVAVLSGLGVGSAGLLVVWLTLTQGTPQLTAQGQNLIFFIFSSGAALLVHLFRTPLLWECALFLIPSGLIGALLGTSLTAILPQALLRRIFGAMLIAAGTLGVFSRKKGTRK